MGDGDGALVLLVVVERMLLLFSQRRAPLEAFFGKEASEANPKKLGHNTNPPIYMALQQIM